MVGRDEADTQERGALGAIAGEALREVLLGVVRSPSTRPWVVQGAHVTGSLDLSDAEMQAPLTFVECTFDAPFVLERLTVPYLCLSSCHLPGIVAGLCRVQSDLTIANCEIAGATPYRSSAP